MDTAKVIEIGDAENPKKKTVLRFPFAGIENAYIILSFKSQQITREHISIYTKYMEPYYPNEPMMSFFYAGPNAGAEWAPECGPIMCYTKCDENWRGKTFHGTELKPKEHWFYDLVCNEAAAWSQLAVDDERLPQKLAGNDFAGIFCSLKTWALRNEE